MKKKHENTQEFISNFSSKTYLQNDKIKTTNVNILLNRVRIDKIRTLRKRIAFSIILSILVSLLAFYFTI